MDGPVALFIEGPPGIGKTTLLEACLEQANGDGIRVLRCRPSQTEARHSHAGLVELLHSTPEGLVGALPGVQRGAMRVALRWDEPGDFPNDPMTVAAATATLITAIADHGPLLVALDDLHRLDAGSAQALEFAVRRAGTHPVGVIAAARNREGNLPRPLERALAPSRIRKMALGPLTEDGVRELLEARMPGLLTPGQRRRVAKASAGNPFLALETARAVHDGVGDERIDGPHVPVPEDIRELVSARLAGLPPATRHALLQAAATGDANIIPADARPAAEATGIITCDADDGVRFTHPLHEAAVYAAAEPHERRAVHRELADHTLDIEVRGQHLALAATGPDEATALAVEHAGRAAFARGAIDVATTLSHRAWRLTPDDDPRRAVARAITTCELLLQTGRQADVRAILAEIEPALTDADRAAALRVAGEACVWGGTLMAAVPLFERALQHLTADPADDATAAWLHLGLSFALFQSASTPGPVLHHATQAVERAQAAGPPGPLAEALACRAIVHAMFGLGIDGDALDRADALFDDRRPVPVQFRPAAIRATIDGYTDRIVAGCRGFQRELELARERGAIADLPYLLLHLSVLSAFSGDRATLEIVAREAVALADELGGDFANATAGIAQSYLHCVRHETDRARAVGTATLALAQRSEIGFTKHWVAGVMGQMELALGEPAAALGWMEAPLSDLPMARFGDPGFVFHIPDFVEALLLTGQRQRASDVLDAYQRACAEMDRRWAMGASLRCRALLEAMDGDLTTAASTAVAAVEQLAPTGHVIELGRAQLGLGRIERRRRRRGAARAAFTEALATFSGAENELWAACARDELARTWEPAGPTGLTPTELRTAHLVVEGFTNGEIAERLYVSRRTVESTLTRVYAKLGVRGRTELARRLADGELQPPDPG